MGELGRDNNIEISNDWLPLGGLDCIPNLVPYPGSDGLFHYIGFLHLASSFKKSLFKKPFQLLDIGLYVIG